VKIIAGKMLPQVKPRTIAQRVRTYGQVPVVQAARMKTSNGINMTNPLNILFVDDDEDFGEGCARWFQRQGHHVAISTSGQDGRDLCSHHDFDIAILDWNLPGLSGLQLVQRMRGSHPDTEVIVLTGEGTINNAVESMRLGVFDFQTKPFPIGDLERRCLAAVKRRKLKKENTQLRELITRSRKPAHQMIGQSEPMRKLFSLIDRVAPTESPC